MPGPSSQAQAGFFGAIAAGKRKVKGFPASEAKKRLEGVKVSSLPEHASGTKRRKKLTPNEIDRHVKAGRDFRI